LTGDGPEGFSWQPVRRQSAIVFQNRFERGFALLR
jgi:hypothetical protein